MKKLFTVCIIVLSVLFLQNQLYAAEWPSGKITLLVPYKAGGSADAMGRGLAKYWEKYLGVPVIVDNRDGASSQVGTTIYSRMPVDGNSVYLGCQVYFSSNIITHNAKYQFDQFELLNIQQEDPIEISVLNDSKYKSAKALFEAIKNNPGKLKCGYIAGGPQNIAASILKKEYGLDFKSVTYDNGNSTRTALLGKHVDFMIGNSGGDISLAGKARILVILGQKRGGMFPDIPTFAEVFDGKQFAPLSVTTFIAVHSDLKKKYPERYEKLLKSYQQTMDDPGYKKFLEESKQNAITQNIGPEKSAEQNRAIHELVKKYKDDLVVKK